MLIPPATGAGAEAGTEQSPPNPLAPMMATFHGMYGRRPMLPGDIIDKLGTKGDWPEEVMVLPHDFMFMAQLVAQTYLDKDGNPYFLLAATKVRPWKPREGTLDLRDWEPARIKLAEFARS